MCPCFETRVNSEISVAERSKASDGIEPVETMHGSNLGNFLKIFLQSFFKSYWWFFIIGGGPAQRLGEGMVKFLG